MKILHTSDWHLGKRLENFSRLQEQKQVLEEISCIADAENVDVVLIAGDIFDNFNPTNESTELLYKTLKRLAKNGERPVIVIAGNHDSPDKIEVSDPLARECGIIFIGYPNTNIQLLELDSGIKITKTDNGFFELYIPKCKQYLRVIATPYANEERLKEAYNSNKSSEELSKILHNKWSELANTYCDNTGINILITHLFIIKNGIAIPEESDDERTIQLGGAEALDCCIIPKVIQYTALGHIHKFWEINNEPNMVIYSGSPLSYSMNETKQKKYVIIADIEVNAKTIYKKVELQAGFDLVKVSFDSIDKAIEWLNQNQNCYVELTIISDDFLSAKDQKLLYNSHQRIIRIIPIVNLKEQQETNLLKKIDLNKTTEELFIEYFEFINKTKPNQAVMELFSEIMSIGDIE